MSPFSTFAILYMTAFLVDMAQGFQDQVFTVASLVVITSIIILRTTRIGFLLFLVLSTAFILVVRFPDVPNHVNVMLYCNVVMIVTMSYSFGRYRDYATDDDYFDMVSPVLRASLILVYVLAGFHKLNSGFFDPDVSCAGTMLFSVGKVGSILTSNLFGVAATLMLVAAGAFFILRKLARETRIIGPKLMLFSLLLIMCAGVALYSTLLLVKPQLGILVDLIPSLVIATALFTVLWELGGGLLLAIPKFQAPVLLLCCTMHAVLAMIGFVDFSALAFALLFTFIPSSYYQVLNSDVDLRFPGLPSHRAHVYFMLNVIGAIVSGGIFSDPDTRYLWETYQQVSGLFFVLAALIFIWPILSLIFSPSRRPVWDGVPVLNREMPRFMVVFLILLFLYGMTPYLGLRTTGNFSMFSNLRTDGSASNHLLLRSNPIKIWDYQEDVVLIIRINDRRAWNHPQYMPLEGKSLPVVEFKKNIYKWTQAEKSVPLKFEYRGKTYRTADIVKDPVWRTEKRNWEMMLLQFRAIPPGNSPPCLW